MMGLVTIGVNNANNSCKVSLEFLKDTVDGIPAAIGAANAAASAANAATLSANAAVEDVVEALTDLEEVLDGLTPEQISAWDAALSWVTQNWSTGAGDTKVQHYQSAAAPDGSTDGIFFVKGGADARFKLYVVANGAVVQIDAISEQDLEDRIDELTKDDVGLDQVDNTSDMDKPISTAVAAALDLLIPLSQKGAANGVATLGADTKVPATQLPSIVFSVHEYANFGLFPATGEQHKIYIDAETGMLFRWTAGGYEPLNSGDVEQFAEFFVRYDAAQSLNPTQKQTARTNIGAAADDAVVKINADQAIWGTKGFINAVSSAVDATTGDHLVRLSQVSALIAEVDNAAIKEIDINTPTIFSSSVLTPDPGERLIQIDLVSQAAAQAFMSPPSSAGQPFFRSLVEGDIPALSIPKVTGLQTILDNKQPLNGNLTAIAGLSGTGLVRKTGVNAFALDTNVYLTAETDPKGVASAAFSGGATKTLTITLRDSSTVTANFSDIDTTYSGSTSIILSGSSFQRAALTGEVTAAQNSNALTIAAGVVTNAKLANMATGTIKGRVTAGTGVVEDLTASQVRTLLNVADGANNYVHPTGDGNLHVPATGTGNAGKFLKAGAVAASIMWASIAKADIGDWAHTHPISEVTGLQAALDSKIGLSSPITGYTTGSDSAIAATDTILQAFGKAQGQINARVPTSRTLTVNGTAGRVSVTGGTQDLTANRTWAVDLAASGVSAGTYPKVTVDIYGRATAGASLVAGDIPNLDASKTTTGVFPVTRLGTGTPSAGTYLAGNGAWTTFPTTMPPSAHPHLWADITDKPNNGNYIFNQLSSAQVSSNAWVSGILRASANIQAGYASGVANSINIGLNRTADAQVFLDFYTNSAANTAYTSRIQRDSGGNGVLWFYQRGTGTMAFRNEDTAAFVFQFGTTDQYRIYTSGNHRFGGGSDSTLAKVQVAGAIQQTALTGSMVKTDANGVFVAAVGGTDYLRSSDIAGNFVLRAGDTMTGILNFSGTNTFLRWGGSTIGRVGGSLSEALILSSATGSGSVYLRPDGDASVSGQLFVTTSGIQWNANIIYHAGNFPTEKPDLQAIEVLSGTSGLLRKTAANTWALDTNAYITAASLPANYVTTDTNQTGLSGTKTWINNHTFSSTVTANVYRTSAGNTDYHLFTRNASTNIVLYIQNVHETGPLLHLLNGSATANEGTSRFIVNGLGRVGIGIASPTEALHVIGNIRQSVLTNSLLKANATGVFEAATATDITNLITGGYVTMSTNQTSGLTGNKTWNGLHVFSGNPVQFTNIAYNDPPEDVGGTLTSVNGLSYTTLDGFANLPAIPGLGTFVWTSLNIQANNNRQFQLAHSHAGGYLIHRGLHGNSSNSWKLVADTNSHLTFVPPTTSSVGSTAGSFRITRNTSGTYLALDNNSASQVVVIRSWSTNGEQMTLTEGSLRLASLSGTGVRPIGVNSVGLIQEYTPAAVNNGTLTLSTGTGLTGTQTFTANQAGNATFTVGLDTKLSNLQALGGTGFVKQTGTNAWAIDTNTYLTNADLTGHVPIATSGYNSVTGSVNFNTAPFSTYVRQVNIGGTTNAPAGFTGAGMFSIIHNDGSLNYGGQLLIGRNGDSSFYRGVDGNATTWGSWYRIASREFVDSTYTPLTRNLTAGNGLTGGGDLTTNRTFTLGTPTTITLSSTNSVTTESHTHAFVPGGTTAQYIRGDGSLATFPDAPAAQTLSHTDGGNVTISAGNTIQVNSLFRKSHADFYTFLPGGMYSIYSTTGSVNYPSSTGMGILVQRDASSSNGRFAIWSQANTTETLYYNIGDNGWKIIADRNWVTTQLAGYVTMATNQTTGLTGNKVWAGVHTFNNAVQINAPVVDADGSAGSGDAIQNGISYWDANPLTNRPAGVSTIATFKFNSARAFQLFVNNSGSYFAIRGLHSTTDTTWRRVLIDYAPSSLSTGQLLQYNGANWVNFTPNYLTANQTITLSGAVTGSGTTAITTTLADNAVTTTKIAGNTVTLAKLQTIATQTLLGRYTASTGDVQTITLGTGLTLNATTGVLSAAGSGGTVTTFSAGALSPLFTTNVATATSTPALTFTLSNAAAYTVFGRAASTGVPSFLSLSADHIPNLNASKITAGVLDTARLGTGTANSTTYLAGDGTWKTYSGGALTETYIGVGNSSNVLSGSANLRFLSSRYIDITSGSGTAAIGVVASSTNIFLQSVNGNLLLQTGGAYRTIVEGGVFRVNDLAGAGTRFVQVNSSGDLIATLSSVTATLNDKQIGFGNGSNQLSGSANFTFESSRYVYIVNGSGVFASGVASGVDAFVESPNGHLLLQAHSSYNVTVDRGGFKVNALAGSGTRMVTVDSSGNFGSQTIPSGGTPSLNSEYIGFGNGSNQLSGITGFRLKESRYILIDAYSNSANGRMAVGTWGSSAFMEAPDGNLVLQSKSGDEIVANNTFRAQQHSYFPNGATFRSDIRKKTCVVDLTGALSKLMQIRGIEYTMEGRRSYGIPAQEVQKVMPHAITTDKDGTLFVDYNAMHALSFNAIKELNEKKAEKSEVEKLKQRIKFLENKLGYASSIN